MICACASPGKSQIDSYPYLHIESESLHLLSYLLNCPAAILFLELGLNLAPKVEDGAPPIGRAQRREEAQCLILGTFRPPSSKQLSKHYLKNVGAPVPL